MLVFATTINNYAATKLDICTLLPGCKISATPMQYYFQLLPLRPLGPRLLPSATCRSIPTGHPSIFSTSPGGSRSPALFPELVDRSRASPVLPFSPKDVSDSPVICAQPIRSHRPPLTHPPLSPWCCYPIQTSTPSLVLPPPVSLLSIKHFFQPAFQTKELLHLSRAPICSRTLPLRHFPSCRHPP